MITTPCRERDHVKCLSLNCECACHDGYDDTEFGEDDF